MNVSEIFSAGAFPAGVQPSLTVQLLPAMLKDTGWTLTDEEDVNEHNYRMNPILPPVRLLWYSYREVACWNGLYLISFNVIKEHIHFRHMNISLCGVNTY